MYQGPPRTPPTLEKIEFKIFRPGEKYQHKTLEGVETFVVEPGKRLIQWEKGKEGGAYISLGEKGEYLIVNQIMVHVPLQKQGVGTKLYEEALKLAVSEGKKRLN